jgi:hypothetical protein
MPNGESDSAYAEKLGNEILLPLSQRGINSSYA